MAEAKKNLMTITVFISRAGTNPTKDNRIYQKIKEAFNVEFQFEYVVGEIGERGWNNDSRWRVPGYYRCTIQ